MKDYEICSELIDVLIDVTCIYGASNDQELQDEPASGGQGSLTFDEKSSASIKLHHAPTD